MDQKYCLWHIAMGGWFTVGGYYSTQFPKAMTYSRERALKIAKLHVVDGELGVIVVALADVEEVLRDER